MIIHFLRILYYAGNFGVFRDFGRIMGRRNIRIEASHFIGKSILIMDYWITHSTSPSFGFFILSFLNSFLIFCSLSTVFAGFLYYNHPNMKLILLKWNSCSKKIIPILPFDIQFFWDLEYRSFWNTFYLKFGRQFVDSLYLLKLNTHLHHNINFWF